MDEVSPYLDGLALRAASHLGQGTEVAISYRHRGVVVRAGSTCDEVARCTVAEVLAGSGPALQAMAALGGVVVDDVRTEERWEAWRAAAEAEGFASVLALPAHVAPATDVVVEVYRPAAGPWEGRSILVADGYAQQAARALAERLHLTGADAVAAVRRTLSSRQVVHQAVGAIMECNACGSAEALAILRSAAGDRNVRIEEVASTVLQALTGVRADVVR